MVCVTGKELQEVLHGSMQSTPVSSEGGVKL